MSLPCAITSSNADTLAAERWSRSNYTRLVRRGAKSMGQERGRGGGTVGRVPVAGDGNGSRADPEVFMKERESGQGNLIPARASTHGLSRRGAGFGEKIGVERG